MERVHCRHCAARVSRIEISTYGPGRPETRFIKRIRLTVPPVRDNSLLLGTDDLLTGPQHAVR